MKKIVLILMIAALLLPLSACKKEEPSAPVSAPAPSSSSESSSGPEGPFNPLTGMSGYDEAAVGKRPVAIMINNIKAALPQYGIYDADLMVEAVVEGGITRMMAVYSDYTKVPDVCSIRSCRYYYPIFAASFDAIYVHWGSENNYAIQTLAELGTDRLDGYSYTGEVFARDQERLGSYALEHCGYVKGQNLAAAFETLEMRTDLAEGRDKPIFDFLLETEPEAPEGTPCIEANLQFSDSYYSTFTYDSATRTYLKQHSGSPHMDDKAGKQLAYTNVFALETEVSVLDGSRGIMRVGWEGGAGYYISNGAAQEITWKKADKSAPIQIFDASGAEIEVNAGKSYLGFIAPGRTTIEGPAVSSASASSALSSAAN